MIELWDDAIKGQADACSHFRPGPINPGICRWWMAPPPVMAWPWEPFCCSTMRVDPRCPTEGRHPREMDTEEDSFE